MTYSLSLDRVSCRYHGTAKAAVSDVSFSVEEGVFLTLLGPSGSGKTTTLMMIAGFERPTSGRILLGSQDVTRVPPARRDIGMVFQNYALFPHLTVRENVAFPLRVRNERGAALDRRVDEALALVQMSDFAQRLPRQLSGGQQQRVSFARAVVFQPRLLLMDEPLSALDRRLRIQMQIELKALQRRLGITIVYVTHDQEEALALSDSIVIMDHGKVEQQGAPHELYRRPANLFVAGFLGTVNTLRCRSEGGSLLWGSQRIPVTCGAPDSWMACLRPEDIVLGPLPSGVPGGLVTQAVYLGEVTQYQVTMHDGETLTVRSGGHGFMPALGDRVAVSFRESDAIVLPREGTSCQFGGQGCTDG